MQKIFSLILSAVLVFTLPACTPQAGNTVSQQDTQPASLNILLKEDDEVNTLRNAANAFAGENGKVSVSAINDDYFEALKIKLSQPDAPTLFVLENSQQIARLNNSLEELSGEAWVNNACQNTISGAQLDGHIYAMPAALKGIGIVYNSEIFEKAGINSENLNSLARLREATEILDQRIKRGDFREDYPNLKGVFAIDEDFDDSLSKLLLSAEFDSAMKLLRAENIEGTYLKEVTALIDLINVYRTGSDISSLANEETIMTFSDTYIYDDVYELDPKTADKLSLMPLSVEGAFESKIILETTHYWAINKNASDADKKAAKKFLEWLYTDKDGKEYVTRHLNYIHPLNTFDLDDEPDAPLLNDVKTFADAGKTIADPLGGISEEKIERLSRILADYAEGEKTLDECMSELASF